MLGLKPWQVKLYLKWLKEAKQPYALPDKKKDHPFYKYYAKVSPKVLAWFLLAHNNLERFESTKQLQQDLKAELNVSLSLRTIWKVFRHTLNLKYKKVYQIESRANYV